MDCVCGSQWHLLNGNRSMSMDILNGSNPPAAHAGQMDLRALSEFISLNIT